MGKIEVGKYYLNSENGELLYVFGAGGIDVVGSIAYPEDVDEKDVINMIAFRVSSFITKEHFLQFKNSVETKTVYKETGIPVYSYGYNEWKNISPPNDLRSRFEKTFKFMDLIKIFIDHMNETYRDKYGEETISARDILR